MSRLPHALEAAGLVGDWSAAMTILSQADRPNLSVDELTLVMFDQLMDFVNQGQVVIHLAQPSPDDRATCPLCVSFVLGPCENFDEQALVLAAREGTQESWVRKITIPTDVERDPSRQRDPDGPYQAGQRTFDLLHTLNLPAERARYVVRVVVAGVCSAPLVVDFRPLVVAYQDPVLADHLAQLRAAKPLVPTGATWLQVAAGDQEPSLSALGLTLNLHCLIDQPPKLSLSYRLPVAGTSEQPIPFTQITLWLVAADVADAKQIQMVVPGQWDLADEQVVGDELQEVRAVGRCLVDIATLAWTASPKVVLYAQAHGLTAEESRFCAGPLVWTRAISSVQS